MSESVKKPHIMVFPYPAQGHVAPFLKLSYKIAEHGIKVTFVNTEFIHAKIFAEEFQEKTISFVTISDGLDANHNRKLIKEYDEVRRFMKIQLQNLIERINNSSERITHFIGDTTLGWALEIARKMGIKRSGFAPAGVTNLAFVLNIPKLMESSIIDADGIPTSDESISLSKDIPPWNPEELTWSFPGNPEIQKVIFELYCCEDNLSVANNSDWLITNSFYELEKPAYDHLISKMLPIGPLMSTQSKNNFHGSFWPEDSTCLSWLDKQPDNSVIYVAFGSLAVISQKQLDEITFGLEMSGQPFLWVVRTDLMSESGTANFPEGFEERTANRGKIVQWASQEKVLSHGSVACFVSHCGWNSTMEGISRGIPFLCWPYFVDQFHNRSYICETWKIGLSLEADEHGIITRNEIEAKIRRLISDDTIKANALKLKENALKSASDGGSSFSNFQFFIEQIKLGK